MDLSKASADWFKIKVFYEDGQFYIFSRFEVAQVLVASGLDRAEAYSISRNTKQALLDRTPRNQTISHSDLQAMIHSQIPEARVKVRYSLLCPFFQARHPFVVVLKSQSGIGKQVAALLAEQFYINNVFHASIVEFLEQSVRQSVATVEGFSIRVACECDLEKAFKDGKPLIIEGGDELLPSEFFPPDPCFQQPAPEGETTLASLLHTYGPKNVSKNWKLRGKEGRAVVLSLLICEGNWPALEQWGQYGLVVRGVDPQAIVNVIKEVAVEVIAKSEGGNKS
jgi:hypothetical protein